MSTKKVILNFLVFSLFSFFFFDIYVLPTKKNIKKKHESANCNFTEKDHKALELDIEKRKKSFNNLLSSCIDDEKKIEEAKKLMFVSSDGKLLPIIVVKDKVNKFELTSVLFGCPCARAFAEKCPCRKKNGEICASLDAGKNEKQKYYRVKDQILQAIKIIKEDPEVKKTIELAIANPNSKFSLSRLKPETKTIQSFSHLFSFGVDNFIFERALFSDWKNFERRQRDIRISIPGTMIFCDGSERDDCLYTFAVDKVTKEIYHRKMEWIWNATHEEMAALSKGKFNYFILKELQSYKLASLKELTDAGLILEIEANSYPNS